MESGSVVIKGIVTEGLAESCFFTSLSWVREQFISKLDVAPYPGTFNLDVVDEDIDKFRELKKHQGIEIVPGEAGFCKARCFLVRLCDTIRGALVIPLVPGYPESKLEIVSAHNIRKTLSLKNGDLVRVEIFY